jgi:redox-sensitive bicupin YhaK (pirin superfamily)
MITLRRSDERGHASHGWLEARHTFSFADYHDPRHMGFRALRVINEDRVAPGQGFGTHGHRDMEIVTVVLEGALRHRDSMGNEGVIRPGEVQRMSAGTGVLHSEMNASQHEPVRLLQIWLLPEREGIAPGYEQAEFPRELRRNELVLAASRDGRQGSVTIHQDAELRLARLDAGKSASLALRRGRHAWVQVASGSVRLGSGAGAVLLSAGDGAALSEESEVALEAGSDAEALVFDLA